jgi:hypothetical protein
MQILLFFVALFYLWGAFHVSATVLPVFLEKIPQNWKEKGWVSVATLAYFCLVVMIADLVVTSTNWVLKVL